MELFYEALFDRFHELHQQMGSILDEMPADALDWQPGAGMNSINVLVTHITGAERFLIGDIIMGESSNRVRDAEFEARGQSKEDLHRRIEDTDAYIKGAFERLGLSDLGTLRIHPRHGKQVSVSWAILHALEHAGIHVGHMELTTQLHKLPDWEG